LVIAFLDACALIYKIEGAEPFASSTSKVLGELATSQPKIGTSISRLTWLECRVGPMKSDNQELLQKYDAFFALPDLKWIELSQFVVELAAHIRAAHGLKTPDSLQAASCLQLGKGHVFLTGDPAFSRVAGLNVRLLS
jgi:predicted nucleic acid-binding protein